MRLWEWAWGQGYNIINLLGIFYPPGPSMKPIASAELIPAIAPVLSFSVVASDTYDLITAAVPKDMHVM